jgi:hypothetical protein
MQPATKDRVRSWTTVLPLAAEAFIYGFPLVFDVQEVDRFALEGIGAVPATPFNQLGHASALAGPETKFMSVNNDTVYSIANVDTSGGPVRLEVRPRGIPSRGRRRRKRCDWR